MRAGNPARKAAGPIVLNVVPPPISEAPPETGLSGFADVSKDTDRRDSVRNFERVHVRVGSSASLSEPHTSCEMERLWALGHFNLGKCTALDAVVAGSRRQCGMERALHTGIDWKMPPVSALQRDMELKVPTKPERRGMALHNPVKPEKKPVVLFPSDRFKPLSISIPGMPGLLDCAWNWLS